MCGSTQLRVRGRRLNVHQGLRPAPRPALQSRSSSAVNAAWSLPTRCRYPATSPSTTTSAQRTIRPSEYLEQSNAFEHYADRFYQLWHENRRPRALDVGAGIGHALKSMEERGFDAFGLEPSPAFHDRAIERGVPEDHLQLAAIETAEWTPHSFDFVNMGAVLEHLPNPAAAIERALDWLAPGGLIFAEVPSSRWLLSRTLNLLYRAQGLELVTNLSPMHPPYHLYEFTLDSFLRHGSDSGYEVVAHRIIPANTFLPAPLDRVLTRMMKLTDTGMQLQVWLSRL